MSARDEPPVGDSPQAAEAAARALQALRRAAEGDERALDEAFAAADAFHAAAFEASPDLDVRCTKGCASCCSQQVFDVRTFEVARIGRRLLAEGRVEEVWRALDVRERAWRETEADVREATEPGDERIERTALAFWTRDLPCTLLDDDGKCSVHDIRPWSCRRSFAASDPALCTGAHATAPERRFFVLDPSQDFDAALDAVDRARADFDVDTDRLDLGLARWLDRHASSD